ncbi:MAG: hypothetical protein LKI94_05560 [Sporolactobacillus sp.]|jgi:hypothetical protein|nr:hypothetical protein [Sporolactobacillus sp.]
MIALRTKNNLFKMILLVIITTLVFFIVSPGTFAHAAAKENQPVSLNETLIQQPSLETDTHTVALDKNGNVVEVAQTNNNFTILAKSKRKVIASYTLSKKQTKNLAKNMKKSKSNRLRTLIRLLGSLSGPYGVLAAAASILAMDSLFSKTVIKAAKKGKRIKITITDTTPHTSYSTQVKYSIVK